MIEDLIRRARRRILLNEVLRQLAFAGAITVAGIAIILLLGTRFLEWWTLGIFLGTGLVLGVLRLRRAIPTQYAAAVELDQRAQTHDSLSTAVWFGAHPNSDPRVSDVQRSQAEAAAGSVDLENALPFSFPRALYVMAGLAVLASSLLLVRYLSTKSLDLRAPITEVLFEDQAAKQVKAKNAVDPATRRRMQAAEDALSKLGVNMNSDDQKSEEEALEKAIEAALNKENPGKDGMDKGGDESKAGADKDAQGDPMDQEKTDSEDENQQSGKNQNASDKGESKNGKQSEDSSLVSKLKDAVSNMFSRDKKDGQQQQSQNKQNQQGGQPEKAQKGDKGEKSDDASQSEGTDRDNEPTGASDQKKDAQGKAAAKSNADAQSSKGGSGAGSQDGAKDIKAAEQLKAMGKISEIIGKRATTISGDSMVEVQDTDPRARTSYTNKTAAHGDADSDVNRDEIPVELQSYVQEYFDQVHKPATVKPAAPKAAPKQ